MYSGIEYQERDGFAYIYVLIDPRNYQVRYVGKTNNIKCRYKDHCTIQRSRSYRSNWLKHLRSLELKPIIKVVDICNMLDWQWHERWWIAYGKSCGWKLTNHTAGGEGQKTGKLSEEHKRKIGEKAKGNKNMLGKIFTLEHRWNLGKATRGIPKSAEHNEKNSKAQRGELNHMSKLTKKDVLEIRRLLSTGLCQTEIAKQFNVSCRLISMINTKDAWGWLEDDQAG